MDLCNKIFFDDKNFPNGNHFITKNTVFFTTAQLLHCHEDI